MSIDDADGVWRITRADFDALEKQYKQVLAANAQICDEARRLRSEAVEQRVLFGDARFERQNR